MVSEFEAKIGGEKNLATCKAQWNAAVKKYKSFFEYKTGNGTAEESVKDDATEWELFEIMHEYAKHKDNYHPPLLLSSTTGMISKISEPEPELLPSSPASIPIPEQFPATAPNHALIQTTPTPSSSISRAIPSSSGASSRSVTPVQHKQDQFDNLNNYIIKDIKKSNKHIKSLMFVFGQVIQQDFRKIRILFGVFFEFPSCHPI